MKKKYATKLNSVVTILHVHRFKINLDKINEKQIFHDFWNFHEKQIENFFILEIAGS